MLERDPTAKFYLQKVLKRSTYTQHWPLKNTWYQMNRNTVPLHYNQTLRLKQVCPPIYQVLRIQGNIMVVSQIDQKRQWTNPKVSSINVNNVYTFKAWTLASEESSNQSSGLLSKYFLRI